MKPILLPYGRPEPIPIDTPAGTKTVFLRGPAGVKAGDVGPRLRRVLDTPLVVPPLERHVVAGDRVAVALSGPVPCAAVVVAAVRERLEQAGVSPSDTIVLRAPPIAGLEGSGRGDEIPGSVSFDPGHESETAYIAADPDGNALHLARVLVDADVVVTVGVTTWDAALGGPALDGDLWPTFARRESREGVVRRLARSGRRGLEALRERSREIGWQLGAMASLRVVPGHDDSLHAALFGTPSGAAEGALARARGWRPRVSGRADLALASLSDPAGGWTPVVRAVAAAARAVRPDGTVCLASRLADPPGPVLLRWRQGAALVPLVSEALRSGDPALVADACITRFLARALGERRLVLLSDLDGESVEELDFGHAADPQAIERLASRARELVVLHEADRMHPRRIG